MQRRSVLLQQEDSTSMELDLSAPVQEVPLPHGWVARIGLTRSSAAQLAGWATLLRDGQPRARLVLSQLGNDPARAHDLIRARVEEWILEWSAEPHSGDTHFGELSPEERSASKPDRS